MAIRAITEAFIQDPDGTIVVRMILTDDSTFKKQVEYRLKPFNLEDLKSRVRSDAQSVKTPEDPKVSLTAGQDFDYSPTPPTPPADPTPEELARRKFLKDLETRRQMEKAIALGLKTVGDKDYADQVSLVKSEFIDPDYVPYL